MTPTQIRGLRQYLYNVSAPSLAVTQYLLRRGFLEQREFCCTLTPAGEKAAMQLSHEEEQELMGLLTHEYVLFQYGHMGTRLFKIHQTLSYLGISVQQMNPEDNTIKFTFRCP